VTVPGATGDAAGRAAGDAAGRAANAAVGGKEQELVELVTPTGVPVGAATVADAHAAPGRLHRAFSVLLVNPQRQLLLQQRAAGKTRFPLRWANATCGHPAPGAPVVTEAARRLGEELGVRDVTLDELGVYTYRADDPATGRVEYEFDHVLLGRFAPAGDLTPDPAEVAALRWMSLAELEAAMAADPDDFAPWLAGVTGLLVAHGHR
jgi:isopentenyl-diphosphate Delta-isomerase